MKPRLPPPPEEEDLVALLGQTDARIELRYVREEHVNVSVNVNVEHMTPEASHTAIEVAVGPERERSTQVRWVVVAIAIVTIGGCLRPEAAPWLAGMVGVFAGIYGAPRLIEAIRKPKLPPPS